MKSILVVSDEKETYHLILSCFQAEYRVELSNNKLTALDMLRKRRYDLVFIDLSLLMGHAHQGNGYKSAMQPFWRLYPSIEIIVMSSQQMIREAVMAVKAGASNYLTYPLNIDEVKYVTENIYETVMLQSELDYLRDKFWLADSLEIVQTKNNQMKKVYEKIRSVAPTKSTILLTGETGTGKGVFSRLIHRHSNRRDEQFISVHCGAIPDTLLESELFGYEKGAFTGADRRKMGKFEIAEGGTIFLDEIGTITPSAQIKLLQILQDGTMSRVGGEEVIKTNVRVIAATNTDLKKMCEEGLFRNDLFYRLNVFPIEIPPLRERIEDIPFFVEGFLKKLNKSYSKEIHDIHPQILDAFQRYPWPGNIRELENLIERAFILETSSVLTPESFPIELQESDKPSAYLQVGTSSTLAEIRRTAIEEVERRYLKELLSQNKGRINKTSKGAGITSRQLHKLMKKYGLRKEEYKL